MTSNSAPQTLNVNQSSAGVQILFAIQGHGARVQQGKLTSTPY